MSKIIKIDKGSRIRITSRNYILEYWKKSDSEDTKAGKKDKEENVFKWRVDGFFPNMVQCITEHILNAPRASYEDISDLKEVIKVIKETEAKMMKIFNKNT